ncbi:MAG: hypothetical protein V1790_17720 [Planctomycetota bacterium]
MEYRITITECTDRGEQLPIWAKTVAAGNPNAAAKLANGMFKGHGWAPRLYRAAVQLQDQPKRWIAWLNGTYRMDIEIA